MDRKIAIINGEEVRYHKLVNTMPLNQFVKLIPEKYGRCVDVSCDKVIVFNFGIDRQALNTKTHWTYVPMKDVNFYRMGYYSNILGSDRLSMYIGIRLREEEEFNVDEQLRLTMENLKKLSVILGHQLVAYNLIRSLSILAMFTSQGSLLKRSGRCDSIIDLLSDLPDGLTSDLRDLISAQKDSEVLKRYLRLASSVDTVEEFKRRMAE